MVHCRVAVRLINGPAETEFVEMPRHAKYPAAGTKRQMRSSTLWLDQADAQVGVGWMRLRLDMSTDGPAVLQGVSLLHWRSVWRDWQGNCCVVLHA